ncbi:MAG: serine hydrolase, partial [Xanthomonadales bacterium]|nr:serine hydrolase [Xanthomonadales bacterium]
MALWIGSVSTAIAAKAPDAAALKVHADQLLEQNYQADGPGAAVLVARGDEVLYRGARGLANVELGVPLAPEQVFRIGSVTKQFAAATVMKLID